MRFEVISLIIFLTIPGYQAYNCTSCEDTTCPPILFGCKGHRAIDPCGCCEHCARGYMEPCGGENWEIGYCNDGLKCAAVNGTGLAEIPNIGICRDLKEFPLKHYFEDNDEICPIRTGCYRAVGHCDCITKHTCILDFFQYSEELCNPMIDFLNRFNEPEGEQRYCFWRGCDITDGKCACESGLCDYTRRFQFRDIWECNKGLGEVEVAKERKTRVPQRASPEEELGFGRWRRYYEGAGVQLHQGPIPPLPLLPDEIVLQTAHLIGQQILLNELVMLALEQHGVGASYVLLV